MILYLKLIVVLWVVLYSDGYGTGFIRQTSDCNDPLGMSDGGIRNSQITCGYEHINSPLCGRCQDARFNYDLSRRDQNWWCTNGSSTEKKWYQVDFKHIVMLTKIVVESYQIKNDPKTFHPSYFTLAFGTSEDEVEKMSHVYDNNQKSLHRFYLGPGKREILVTRKMNAIRLTVTELDANSSSVIRFEFYGCADWTIGQPLGMQSGEIEDGQITYHSTLANQYLNSWAARLFTGVDGWFSGMQPQSNNVYLRVRLKENYRITYMKYETNAYEGSFSVPLKFKIKFGRELDLKYLSNNGVETEFSSPPFSTLGSPAKVIFDQSQVVGNIFIIEPIYSSISLMCPTMKFELYGTPLYIPDHDWEMRDKNSNDRNGYFNFYHEGKLVWRNYHEAQISPYHGYVKTNDLPKDDCLINPSKCHDGLAISFWGKSGNIANVHQKTFYTSPENILMWNGTSCQNLMTGDSMNWNSTMVYHFEHIGIEKFVRATYAYVQYQGPNRHGGTNFDNVRYYINVPKTFITNCQLVSTLNGIQPFMSSKMNTNGKGRDTHWTTIYFGSDLAKITSSPAWKFNSSLTVVISSTINNIVVNSATEARLTISYNFPVCDLYRDDIVSKLHDDYISANSETCHGGTVGASHIKFTRNGWPMCGPKNNWVKFDFNKEYFITGVKIAAMLDPSGWHELKQFSLWTSKDGIEFVFLRKVYNANSKMDYKKWRPISQKEERIMLRYPVTTRWLKLSVEGDNWHYGVKAGVRFDIITCDSINRRGYRRWIKLAANTCFKTKSSSHPAEVLFSEGYDVSFFKLKYISGYFKPSNTGSECRFNQGSKGGIFVTNTKQGVNKYDSMIAPNTFSTYWVRGGISGSTSELTIKAKFPVYVPANEKLHIWHYETLKSVYNDNIDSPEGVCMDVYGWGKDYQGVYIQTRCPVLMQCPCLGVEDGSNKLIYDSECSDMFYFDAYDHMIHASSGQCVQPDSDKILTVNGMDCMTEFTTYNSGKLKELIEVSSGDCVQLLSNNYVGLDDCGSTLFDLVDFPFNEHNYKAMKQNYIYLPESSEGKTFLQAKEMCESEGMVLPILNTLAKFDTWIVMKEENSALLSPSNEFWMGSLDEFNNANYKWIDGSPYEHNTFDITGGNECLSFSDGSWKERKCSFTYKVICEVRQTRGRRYPLISSGLHRTSKVSIGTGFQISITDSDNEHIAFTLQHPRDFHEISANVIKRNEYHHFVMVYRKNQEARLYVDGVQVNVSKNTHNFQFVCDRYDPYMDNSHINIASYYSKFLIGINDYHLSSIKMWRTYLSPIDVYNVYQKYRVTFSEPNEGQVDQLNNAGHFLFSSGCSDPGKKTGPCKDFTSTMIEKKTKKNKIDFFECTWKHGLGHYDVQDLGMMEKDLCVEQCHQKRRLKDGTVGVAYGIADSNKHQCLCLKHYSTYSLFEPLDESYESCFFKMPVYDGIVTSDGEVISVVSDEENTNIIGFTIANAWLLSYKTKTWLRGFDAVAMMYYKEEVWVLKNTKQITDLTGVDYTGNMPCESFAVTKLLYCLGVDGKLYEKKKEVSDFWREIQTGVHLITATSGILYFVETNRFIIYQWHAETAISNIMTDEISTVIETTCVKSIAVTPSRKIVAATCIGLFLWIGFWKEVKGSDWLYVHAIDDNFVYAVKSDKKVYQIILNDGNIPGYRRNVFTKTYKDSVLSCVEQGGNLVSNLYTEERINFMKSMYDLNALSYVGSVQLAANTYEWFDGNPVEQHLFNSGEPNSASEDCLSVGGDRLKLFDVPCYLEIYKYPFTCQVPMINQMHKKLKVHHTVLHGTTCENDVSDAIEFPAYNGDTSSKLITSFVDFNLTRYEHVTRAYVTFYPVEDSDNHYVYYIRVALRETNVACADKTKPRNWELTDPILWNITESWKAGVPVRTPDLSPLISYMLRKTTWTSDEKIGFIFIPYLENDALVYNNMVNSSLTELDIFHNQLFPNRYIYFPSTESSSLTPKYFNLNSLHTNIKKVTFWLLMSGPDCGVLFVWVVYNRMHGIHIRYDRHKLLLQVSGHVNDHWQQVNLETDQGTAVEVFNLQFVVFNNLGPKGHIAIDEIEGHPNIETGASKLGEPTYVETDKVNFYNVLSELKYLAPVLLYPFVMVSYKSDYGPHELHLTLINAGVHDMVLWIGDFYGYYYHMSAIHNRRNIRNARLYNDDVSAATESFSVNGTFSFLVHLKVNVILFDNYGTIFMFADASTKKKFKVISNRNKEIIVKIFNENGEAVFRESFPITSGYLYLAIVYRTGLLYFYLNAQIVGIYTVNADILREFPGKKLSFFRDPDDPESLDHRHNLKYLYHGYMSCFRAYKEDLSSMQIKQYEFCPNRQDKLFHKRACKNGGASVIFLPGCTCSNYNDRYLDEQCSTSLIPTVYNDSLVAATFDRKSIKQTQIGNFPIKNTANGNVSYLPGPVNAAYCVFGDNQVEVLEIESDCLSSFTNCLDGYAFGYWLYFEEVREDKSIELINFNGHTVLVSFVSTYTQNVSVEFKMVDCNEIEQVIGIRVWTHVIVVVGSGRQTVDLYLNGRFISSPTCTPLTTPVTPQKLLVGGVTRTCIDEFVVLSYDDTVNVTNKLYFSIVEGTFSNDERIQNKHAQVRLILDLQAPMYSGYLAEYQDPTSESSRQLEAIIDDFLRWMYSANSRNYISTKLTSVKKLGDEKTWVQADVSMNFQRFGLEEMKLLDIDNYISYFYKERSFVIYSKSFWTSVGLGNAEIINVTSRVPHEGIVYIKPPILENSRYHMGYRIEMLYKNAAGNEVADIHEFMTGLTRFDLTTDVYKYYTTKVYAITHEGYSSPSVYTFRASGRPNDFAPEFEIRRLGYGIFVKWEEYRRDLWNGPDLTYVLTYQLTRSEPDNYTQIYFNDDEFEYNIGDLIHFEEYVVTMATLNNYGISPSKNRTLRTLEDAPEVKPMILSIEPIGGNSNRTQLTWNFTNDIELWNSFYYDGFFLNIWPIYPEDVILKYDQNYFVDNTTVTMTTDPLDYFSVYRGFIRAKNFMGSGPSFEFSFATAPFYPTEGPRIYKLLSKTSTTIEMEIGDIAKIHENGIITNYQIMYKSKDWPDPSKIVNSTSLEHSDENRKYWENMAKFKVPLSTFIKTSVPKSSSLVHVLIKDLVPHTYYQFNITGCNQVGCAVHDKLEAGILMKGSVVTYRTEPEIPACPPKFESLQNITIGSVLLSWENLTDSCKNGDLQNYHVGLLDDDEHMEFVNKTIVEERFDEIPTLFQTTSDELMFSELRSYWKYYTFVIFENQKGRGPSTELHSFLTQEDIPGIPSVSAVAFNQSTLKIEIRLPELYSRNGVIRQYEVYLINELDEQFTYEFDVDHFVYWGDPVSVPREITTVYIPGLRKYFRYNVQVKAKTAAGWGLQTDPIVGRTGDAIPSDSPTDFTVTSVTNDTIGLSWKTIPYLRQHGRMTQFIVNATATLANGTKHSVDHVVLNASTDLSVVYTAEFPGLFPYTLYNFTIVGCTNPGCGPNITVFMTTMEMKPIGAPLLYFENADIKEALSIEFSDILPIYKRGIITNFNVSYNKSIHLWEESVPTPKYQLVGGRGNVNTAVIQNLQNYTNYTVRIAGLTKMGQGPFGEEFIFLTPENVPSRAPEITSAGNLSSFSLFVNFIGLDRQYHEGVLTGYLVIYELSDYLTECLENYTYIEKCTHENNTLFLPINETDISYNGTSEYTEIHLLQHSSKYNVCVAAVTSVGHGPTHCVLTNTDNAIHGNWSEWSEWGSCAESCGNSTRKKYRWCINPEPSKGGDYCKGLNYAEITCNSFPCPDFYLAEPLMECREMCRKLIDYFSCDPFMAKKMRNSSQYFLRPRDPSNFTVFFNLTCEKDSEALYSKPNHPIYNVDEQSCKGYMGIPEMFMCNSNLTVKSENERRLCYCADKDSVMFSEWGTWSPCDRSCGGGTRRRFRTCALDEDLCDPEKAKSSQDCNMFLCPIHGNWGNWSEWSDCSVSCGVGEIRRSRMCNDPEPRFGGKYCALKNTALDIRSGCNPFPCPIHGHWGEWRPIEPCTQPCGKGGTMRKKRYCDNPAPNYNGTYCEGNWYVTQPCNEHIKCKEISVNFVLRFTQEEWNFRMVYDTSSEHRNFVEKLVNNIKNVIKNNTDIVDTLMTVTVNELSRGSVIANFTLTYNEVNSAQVISLQHSIEIYHEIDIMPLKKINITSSDVPPPPSNIFGVSYTPFSISVIWGNQTNSTKDSSNHTNTQNNTKDSSTEVYMYYVFYRRVTVYTPEWNVVGVNGTNMELEDLIPGTLYGFRVLLSVPQGNGIASEEIQVSTIEGPPYIAPPHFTHYVMSYSSVYLSWLPIPTSQIPGKLLGYKIMYREYFGNVTTTVTSGKNDHQKTLSGLTPFTMYWIEIAGFTVAGNGPSSLIVYKTPPGPPGVAPPNVTLSDLYSTDKVSLSWNEIPEKFQYGIMSGYKITYELTLQNGKEVLVGQPITVVKVDKYTLQYEITGLLPYSKFRITLCGYSPNGDGPKFVAVLETCKCPPILYTNYYTSEPYMEVSENDNNIVSGLFPMIIPLIIDNVCTGCKAYSRSILYFNRTSSGYPSRKISEVRTRKYIEDSAHLNFPIHGRMDDKVFAGTKPYIGIVPKQGIAMVVYHEKVKAVGAFHILKTVYSAWSVILICVLMALLFGIAFWFTEQFSDQSDLNIHSSCVGPLQGFWLAFITMTTLGYGDFVPTTVPSKALMVVWVLIGLVSISMFTGVVSSGLTASGIGGDVKIYGTSTAVISESREHQFAIQRNADLSHNHTYNTTYKVLKAVSTKEVMLGLLDASSISGYEDMMKDEMNLRIQEVIDANIGLGVVLADGLECIEEDFRSAIISNQMLIQYFIQKKVSKLVPFLVTTEVELITKEEFIKLAYFLGLIFAGIWSSGLLYWLLCICRRGKQVHPSTLNEDEVYVANEKYVEQFSNTFNNMITEFAKDFETKVGEIDERHKTDRSELLTLRKNYERLLIRSGFTEEQVRTSFEKKRLKAVYKLVKNIKRNQQDNVFNKEMDEIEKERQKSLKFVSFDGF